MNPALQSLFEEQREKAREFRLEPVSGRIHRLRRLLDYVLSHQEDIITALHEDFQKPREEVQTSEIYPVVSEIRHAIENLRAWVEPKLVDTPLGLLGSRAEIRYEAKGVCLIIAPWNFPFNLCLGPLASCLAAGNTAVIKPSEMTPHTSALVRRLVEELFHRSEVAVAEGGVEVASELLKLPFDHVFFTGSPAVGKIVMRAAADHLTSVTLELGGKSPVIIDETADLRQTADRIAFGKFLNVGQTCIAPDYVLVHVSVKDQFLHFLKESTLRLFSAGGGFPQAPSYGRIVNDRHFDRVMMLLEEGRKRGAREVLSGPIDRPGRLIPPHILELKDSESQLMQEEIFGPILPVLGFDHLEEAIQSVNKLPKPLALYIFSKRRQTLARIEKEISSGTVVFNDCIIQFTHVNLPFGGIGNSGIGKSHGYFGFLAFSNEKATLKQRWGATTPNLLYPPYSKFKHWVIKIMIKWL